MKLRPSNWALLVFPLMTCVSARGSDTPVTIIYDDKASEIGDANLDEGQLWITTADLKQATGFELKPQGICRNELCFPLPKSHKTQFIQRNPGKTRFNLAAFAHLVHQPIAHDEALSTWYFGLRSDQLESLSSLKAPDFHLPDMSGEIHSLSDFRGKKVLLVTWASW